MSGALGFLREGWGEISRQVTRLRLRRQLATQGRGRGEALVHLGKTAWDAKLDLSGFEETRDALARLDTRASELAATTNRLEAERAELVQRRQVEVARFEGVSREAARAKTEADTALRAARGILAEKDRAISSAETRLTRIAADLSQPPARADAAANTSAAAPVVGQPSPEALHAEQVSLQAQLAAARIARTPLAADVDRLAAAAQGGVDEVTRIAREHQAALLPIDTDLNRVRKESSGATGDAATVGRDQRAGFLDLGRAFYDRQVADPALAESREAVSAIDQACGTTQVAINNSLAVTAAMPHATMAKFYGTVVLVVAMIIGIAYGLSATRSRSRDFPATAWAAEPELDLSVNYSSAAKIFPGWPLLVQVLIANPSSESELVLAPRGVAWARAVKITATGPDGKAGTLPFELGAEPPSVGLRLPAGASTQFFLVLPEGATRGLAPGKHIIAAVLEISGSGGWNGTARATASVELQRSGEADADQRLELELLRASVHVLRGRGAEARKVLEDYLKANPEAVPALRMMAEILEKEGEIEPAYRYAARAVSAFRKQEEKTKGSPRDEPPAQLLELYRRLQWTLLFKDAKGRPAAAARPPTGASAMTSPNAPSAAL